MITTKQLIEIAPFPEDVKKQLLEKADTFSSDKKFELEETCWALISANYQNMLRFKTQQATLEMAKGEKTLNKKSYDKLENDLLLELTNKLNAVGNQEQIEEIKKQLGSSLSSQPSQ